MFLFSWLSCKTAELTFTDSYIVLIANTPNLNNFRLEVFRQIKGLGTCQPLYIVRPWSALGGFENGIK